MKQVCHSLLFVLTGLLTAGTVAPAAALAFAPAASQATLRAERRATSRLVITVPAEDAQRMVNGNEISGAGTSRTFETGPLAEGTHKYTVSVTWEPNTYTKMTRTKVISFRAGEPVRIDLTVEAPDDRVRVIYVPTPAAVAAAMVELAGVSDRDVVYEPGCGDARITIAAYTRVAPITTG